MTTINMRTTKAEKESLIKAAKSAGLSLSAFLRSAAVSEAQKVLGRRKLRMIKQPYTGVAVCGPFEGCEIEADGPSVPDEQGGQYNYEDGIWSWVPGPGTKHLFTVGRSNEAGGLQ